MTKKWRSTRVPIDNKENNKSTYKKLKIYLGINYLVEDLDGPIECVFNFSTRHSRIKVNKRIVKTCVKYLNTSFRNNKKPKKRNAEELIWNKRGRATFEKEELTHFYKDNQGKYKWNNFLGRASMKTNVSELE